MLTKYRQCGRTWIDVAELDALIAQRQAITSERAAAGLLGGAR